MVNNLLELSRLEHMEKDQLSMQTIVLYDVVEMCVESLREFASQQKIELTICGQSCEIKADPRLIEILVYNLVMNAIQYNRHPGKVFVGVEQIGRAHV